MAQSGLSQFGLRPQAVLRLRRASANPIAETSGIATAIMAIGFGRNVGPIFSLTVTI